MKAKLVVVGGTTSSQEVELRLPAILGRGQESSLVLPHPLVSRQHCEIFEANGKLVVRDLGSLNGTFVGKEKITEAFLLPGQLLTVGTVTFRAVYEPAAQAAMSEREKIKGTARSPRDTVFEDPPIRADEGGTVLGDSMNDQTTPAPPPGGSDELPDLPQ